MSAPLFRSLIAFAALALGALMLFALASSAYTATPSSVTVVENETVTQDVGNWTAVSAADDPAATGFYDNETVYTSPSTQLSEGTDYRWNTSNASVYFENTAGTTDGAPANISYAYDEHRETDAQIFSLISIPIERVGLLVLAPAIMFVTALFAWFASLLLRAKRAASGGGR